MSNESERHICIATPCPDCGYCPHEYVSYHGRYRAECQDCGESVVEEAYR